MAEGIQWIQVGAGLLGGGAMGAVFTAAVTAYRNRKQPVGKRIEWTPIFVSKKEPLSLSAKLVLTKGSTVSEFTNLFIADVQLVNLGNADIAECPFGITLGEGDKCIHLDWASEDRHHAVADLTLLSPAQPVGELDFSLRPFNRRDSYRLKGYVVIPDGHDSPGEIRLSSPRPIRLTDMPSVAETLADIAAGTAVTVGGVKLSLAHPPKRLK
jgi:hypothetical protein